MFHTVSGQFAAKICSASVEILSSIHLEDKFDFFLRIICLHRDADAVHQPAEAFHRFEQTQFFLICDIAHNLRAVDQPSVTLIDKVDCTAIWLLRAEDFFIL